MKIKIEKIVNPLFVSAFSKLCRVSHSVDQLALARCLAQVDSEQKNFRTAETNIKAKYCNEVDGQVQLPVEKAKEFYAELEQVNNSEVDFPIPSITLSQKAKTERGEPFTGMDIYMLDGIVDWN
jgi:hypothetical protein